MAQDAWAEERTMPGGQVVTAVLENVRETLARLLGVDPHSLQPDTPLADQDIDSITAAELVVATQSAMRVRFDVSGIPQDWSDLTVGQLATSLAASIVTPRPDADRALAGDQP